MAVKTLAFALAATGFAAWYASNKQQRHRHADGGTGSSRTARIGSMDASNASSFERGSELSGDEGVRSLSTHSASGALPSRAHTSGGRTDDLLSPGSGAESGRPYPAGAGAL